MREPNSFLQYDPGLGLYYLRVRDMSPLTGRFQSLDPKPGQVGFKHR